MVTYLLKYYDHYNSWGLIGLTGTEDLQIILSYPVKVKIVAK